MNRKVRFFTNEEAAEKVAMQIIPDDIIENTKIKAVGQKQIMGAKRDVTKPGDVTGNQQPQGYPDVVNSPGQQI